MKNNLIKYNLDRNRPDVTKYSFRGLLIALKKFKYNIFKMLSHQTLYIVAC